MLFFRATAENLPEELTGIAKNVYVLFPWGSLLAAVLGKNDGLGEMKKLLAADGKLVAVFSFNREKDQSEFLRLGIDLSSFPQLQNQLREAYQEAGLQFQITRLNGAPELYTTWLQKLSQNTNREFFRIDAHPFISG